MLGGHARCGISHGARNAHLPGVGFLSLLVLDRSTSSPIESAAENVLMSPTLLLITCFFSKDSGRLVVVQMIDSVDSCCCRVDLVPSGAFSGALEPEF